MSYEMLKTHSKYYWIYVTKKKLEHATGVDTSNLAAKSDFIALKAEFDKLYINK